MCPSASPPYSQGHSVTHKSAPRTMRSPIPQTESTLRPVDHNHKPSSSDVNRGPTEASLPVNHHKTSQDVSPRCRLQQQSACHTKKLRLKKSKTSPLTSILSETQASSIPDTLEPPSKATRPAHERAIL